MIDCNLREVDFEKYCKTCVDEDTDEVKDPCNECLSHPYNEQSAKPIHYSEDLKKLKKNSERNHYENM